MVNPIYDAQYILEKNGRTIVPGSVASHRLHREPNLAQLVIREIRTGFRAVLR